VLAATVVYFAFGLAIGSFLNVCICRIPRRESVVLPRSHCPECEQPIRPYDNIPVLSYLWLRGRCRFCQTRISPQYPAVELLTGAALVVCALVWNFAPATYVNSAFLAALIVLIFIDYQHQILPNIITLPGILAGIALSPFQAPNVYRDAVSYGLATLVKRDDPERLLPFAGAILGVALGGGLLLLVGATYSRLRKRQGLGMGDVKMMAMVGAFLGWRLALLTIFVGSLVGSIVGVFLIAFRGKNLQTKLAFGTFLGPGAVIALFFGLQFLEWYAAAR
jgi:leader peptidase (prepilin peptidase) / N-methyltransferase